MISIYLLIIGLVFGLITAHIESRNGKHPMQRGIPFSLLSSWIANMFGVLELIRRYLIPQQDPAHDITIPLSAFLGMILTLAYLYAFKLIWIKNKKQHS